MHESSVGAVADTPDQALFHECIGKIARSRLMQCHALGEIIDAHAFPACDLRESPELRAGNRHSSAHLRIMPARRGIDQPQALKCPELREVPIRCLRTVSGAIPAPALQTRPARANTVCPGPLPGCGGRERLARSSCDAIRRHTREGRLCGSGQNPALSFRHACLRDHIGAHVNPPGAGALQRRAGGPTERLLGYSVCSDHT